ncbi:MAG: 5-(carboxyamino)imidazole ribonucleotide synthase [Pirellulaceae bacterium]
MSKTILPGAVIGVLGSGQLGRMFTIAARQMGYRVHVLSPDDDTPTGQVADVEFRADYEDLDRVTEFARGVDVVTFEFENVPTATTDAVSRHAPVRPAGWVLHTTQNRLREKTFLQSVGLPVTPFTPVRSSAEVDVAGDEFGLPAVLKTAAWGYDGKGQAQVASQVQLVLAWRALGNTPAILERWVDFAREISVVAVRGTSGEIACYDPIVNVHRNHILDVSTSPAGVPPKVASAAVEIAREVVNKLDVVGVLCVEFFVTRDGELLINELAPRPHNSGHLTIDAHVTSQFEQQVRSVCGLPLGSTKQHCPAAMVNLLGGLWSSGEPDWRGACRTPGVKLHLYGKRAPRQGRKMGHLTALADSISSATDLALRARRDLSSNSATPLYTESRSLELR